jgi:hypothetical protein
VTAGAVRIGDAGHRGDGGERAPLLQWIGLFLAPAVFFIHLQLAYVLIPWVCATGLRTWIHVAAVTAVLLAVAGAWAAWRVHARAEGTAADDDAGAVPRTRFLAVVGLCDSVVFVLLLVAQLIAGVVVTPCQ